MVWVPWAFADLALTDSNFGGGDGVLANIEVESATTAFLAWVVRSRGVLTSGLGSGFSSGEAEWTIDLVLPAAASAAFMVFHREYVMFIFSSYSGRLPRG